MRLSNVSKISIGWAILTVAGIGGFALAKTLIDKQRYEAMKVRERMKAAPRGQY